MLFRLICTLLYSLLLGITWSLYFKKSFLDSLAPAYMMHILLVLISGITIGKLSFGIYGGLLFTFLALVYYVFKHKHLFHFSTILKYLSDSESNNLYGILLFFGFYIFCFFSNHGKHFLSFDETSHWGMFLKETLRLDALYCTSPLSFNHKDYVPAITLFETIWCKLSGRFAEPDAYRAIQIFMFSLLMPMFRCFNGHKNKLIKGCSVIFVMIIPLVFNNSDGFLFYHSIYCDIAVGIVFFWCAFEIYKTCSDIIYETILLVLGITVLVLSKMTAISLLPLIISLIILKVIFIEKNAKRAYMLTLIPITIIPVAIWYWFNLFVDKYIPNIGNVQSYDGLSISSIPNVFTFPNNSNISYLGELQDNYFNALLNKDILIKGSYLTVLLIICLGFIIIAKFTNNSLLKSKIFISFIWVFLCGVYHAALMYFLYATSFDPYEVMILASYERYMNSMIISLLLFLIAVYYDSGLWKKHVNLFCTFTFLFILYLTIFHQDSFNQLIPGTLTHEYSRIEWPMQRAEIINSTEESARVYAIYRGNATAFATTMRYYCNPRTIDSGSIGPIIEDNDFYSIDMSIPEFLSTIQSYDYLYFAEIDDVFINKYSGAFEAPELVKMGKIYKIGKIEPKIVLE